MKWVDSGTLLLNTEVSWGEWEGVPCATLAASLPSLPAPELPQPLDLPPPPPLDVDELELPPPPGLGLEEPSWVPVSYLEKGT